MINQATPSEFLEWCGFLLGVIVYLEYYFSSLVFSYPRASHPSLLPFAGEAIMAGFLKNGNVYAAGIACFMRGIP
ncbi:MAG: hypothetical protein IKU32_04375 [Clostridia bacterium]|nr:hypothetical protein [Clostridia bacterium]